MALPSLFRERLEQMEDTRNQRLSLLQTERELQIIKSQLLSTKLSNIRSLEQCCLKFEQKIASRKFAISSLKAQMDSLDSNYDHILQQIRVSKNEVEELEELEKQKESFYGLERHKMERFQAQVENFVVDCQMQVQELRNKINELKAIFVEVKANNEHLTGSEIAAAEMRKSELSAAKENLDRCLASNYQIRTQLQKQLHSLLSEKNKESLASCVNK
ncbi:uncharacterized protein LOC131316688 isoform X1 [Rhododendron vialii]|uniref:uncharacterized protein LOC131316688 isoform X1 n=1 Tax=Rhododendron vialii TaxID=182163 RepID=UPI00265D738D|nr:uncharacterized protein LOC131316688 isoform X1 [Rhododendron vialii]